MRTPAVLSMLLTLACASRGTQTADAPAPSTQAVGAADDCGGLYALDVRNDGDGDVWFAFSDARQLKPSQQIGVLRGRDATTLFFRSREAPLVWAQTRSGTRVFINDRAGLQRYRIRMALRCDKP
jgi:hypothetical protein